MNVLFHPACEWDPRIRSCPERWPAIGSRVIWRILLALTLLLLPPLAAEAHRASDAYVVFEATGSRVGVTLDLPMAEVTELFELDANQDGRVSWGEVLDRMPVIESYVRSRLELSSGGSPWALAFTNPAIVQGVGGVMLHLSLHGEAASPPDKLEFAYHLLFDFDARHRALVAARAGDAVRTHVLGPEAPRLELRLDDTGRHTGIASFVGEGIHHILTGTDHLLFLVALLLPSVLRRREGRWEVASSLREVMGRVVMVVTAFTIAHSLTLGLAVFDLLRPPSRWVESLIALSVGVAAFNNLRPFIHDRSWWVAFGFGLLHGFGFAGALGDLGLTGGAKAWALLGFNAGVEVGQLGVVALLLPVAYRLRRTGAYRVGALQWGSAAILMTGLLWTVDRAAGGGWLPF